MNNKCFNSLQTGRCIQSDLLKLKLKTPLKCFNSLQTGRCIQREAVSKYWLWLTWFQFPSNGKVYPKDLKIFRSSNAVRVSIPFKREGVSKERIFLCCVYSIFVSIPFKREGVSKASFTMVSVAWKGMFQFPSNGKVYPKKCLHRLSSR